MKHLIKSGRGWKYVPLDEVLGNAQVRVLRALSCYDAVLGEDLCEVLDAHGIERGMARHSAVRCLLRAGAIARSDAGHFTAGRFSVTQAGRELLRSALDRARPENELAFYAQKHASRRETVRARIARKFGRRADPGCVLR